MILHVNGLFREEESEEREKGLKKNEKGREIKFGKREKEEMEMDWIDFNRFRRKHKERLIKRETKKDIERERERFKRVREKRRKIQERFKRETKERLERYERDSRDCGGKKSFKDTH